ncbi:MAG: antitoxin, partial [Hyphomicrobiales bacterium]
MAKNSPKSKGSNDPTVSAVEEALKIDFGAEDAKSDGPSRRGRSRRSRRDEEKSTVEAERNKPGRASGTAADDTPPRRDRSASRNRAQRPANDDRQSVGNMLYSINRRPSLMPFWGALAASALWLLFGGIVGSAAFGKDLANLDGLAGLGEAPHLFAYFVSLILPVVFFWVFALMIWRSQEMRIVANGMTEVALRLSEPEDIAKDSVLSVGQAIRREVAAMGDGIERALARASELEVMVHTVVAALERAYSTNESRIRSVVDELVSQREAIVHNSERLRTAIGGARETLSEELAKTSDAIADRVSESGQRVIASLGQKGEQITIALGTAGETMISTLSIRGQELVQNLSNTGQEVTASLQ